MTTLATTPRRNDSFCVRRLGEETIFLAEKGAVIHSLDEMGSFIWEAVDGKRSLAEILDRVCAEFDVSRETAEADLRRFMDELAALELVSWQE